MAKSDGTTASYYELPPNATELQHLIAYKNMNAQMGEIFRANYRYGEVDHSDQLREINKILYYAQAEKERLLKYVYPIAAKEAEEVDEEEFYIVFEPDRKEEDKSPSEQTAEWQEEKRQKLAGSPARPICTVCEKEIAGRVFYLGNEPRCSDHAG